MGGSQGAHGINEAVIKALPLLKELPLQVIHLTGPNDDQVAAANYRREEIPAHVAAFCHQMELAYSAADLALSRSGAASLSELSHFGIPSLLIPYPFAAENHQALNAAIFAREGAAIVVEQGQVSVETFAREIGALLRDAARLGKMSRSARALAPEDAAECVADTVEHAAASRAGNAEAARERRLGKSESEAEIRFNFRRFGVLSSTSFSSLASNIHRRSDFRSHQTLAPAFVHGHRPNPRGHPRRG